ncbi:MAG TPA: 30S ribosomal protein S3 [Candidatus Nanoarchaeia archaeon]|nr:30S ribosomal protein S3 [Candidatus Nanoarchaeia archaeon]
MIERKFVAQKLKEHQIQEYMASNLAKAGYSHTEIRRTPLGEKVIIYTTRPGLVVGKKGDNIKKLTAFLKKRFKMENPQIEIGDVENPTMDVNYIADRIAFNLERFGSKRFKSIGYKVLQDIIDAGALGAEVVLSGKIPSARARSWRFSAGYLKKSGDIHLNKIKKANLGVNLKSGTIGVKVSIMTPDIELPDKMLALKTENIKLTAEQQKIEVTVTDAVDSVPAVAPTEVTTEKPVEEAEAKETKKRAHRKPKAEKKEEHVSDKKE